MYHVYQKVLLCDSSSNTTSYWEEYIEKNRHQKEILKTDWSSGIVPYKLRKTRQSKPPYDKKWGHFQPNCWFNVDQVPLQFVTDRKTTYKVDVPKAQKKDHKVWVSQPGSGLDKRQCLFKVCFLPEKNIVKVVLYSGALGNKFQRKKSWHNPMLLMFTCRKVLGQIPKSVLIKLRALWNLL